MRTVILGEPPKEIEALIESRRATGADLYDEVWEGEYHMAPAPRRGNSLVDYQVAAILTPLATRAGLYGGGPVNLGRAGDFRVPDAGLFRDRGNEIYVSTAALVVEIVSPGDESWEKLPFYAAHDVDEVVIVDPATRTITWLYLDRGEYLPVHHSALLDVGVAEFAAQIDWPPTE